MMLFRPPRMPWEMVGARTVMPRTTPLYSRMRRPCTSNVVDTRIADRIAIGRSRIGGGGDDSAALLARPECRYHPTVRSEEHTSELQSHSDLVCRLLLEKKRAWQGRTRYQHDDTRGNPAQQIRRRVCRARATCSRLYRPGDHRYRNVAACGWSGRSRGRQ